MFNQRNTKARPQKTLNSNPSKSARNLAFTLIANFTFPKNLKIPYISLQISIRDLHTIILMNIFCRKLLFVCDKTNRSSRRFIFSLVAFYPDRSSSFSCHEKDLNLFSLCVYGSGWIFQISLNRYIDFILNFTLLLSTITIITFY